MIRAVKWQRFEGGAILFSGLAIYWQHHELIAWWAALLLFFAPDLSFIGYAFGRKAGAVVYNIVHIYAFGIAVLAAGVISSVEILVAIGAIWLSHAGFDRLLGYGLKTPEGFSFTHLGQIGRSEM